MMSYEAFFTFLQHRSKHIVPAEVVVEMEKNGRNQGQAGFTANYFD